MERPRTKLARRVAVAILVALLVLEAVAPVRAGAEKRLKRASDWPLVDLSGYDSVFIEDCAVTDPKAGEREIQELVRSAPSRMANYISYSIDREVFGTVERRSPESGEQGLVVRVELTQYKPGSAHLDIMVRLLDAATGEEIHAFSESRNFSWGGLYGGTRGITLMEQKAAREIAAYLSLAHGVDAETVIARMKKVELVGGPDVPHGTIVFMRPQGAVGGAVRFRLGVNDVSIGESKRKTYHVVYVKPGEHHVWAGSDKKKKGPTIDVRAGETYYFNGDGDETGSREEGGQEAPAVPAGLGDRSDGRVSGPGPRGGRIAQEGSNGTPGPA